MKQQLTHTLQQHLVSRNRPKKPMILHQKISPTLEWDTQPSWLYQGIGNTKRFRAESHMLNVTIVYVSLEYRKQQFWIGNGHHNLQSTTHLHASPSEQHSQSQQPVDAGHNHARLLQKIRPCIVPHISHYRSSRVSNLCNLRLVGRFDTLGPHPPNPHPLPDPRYTVCEGAKSP
uniref:Uncharacterized protein n=1 Tax=Pristionchus pacificus TaxID=54126 RepID=A0A8R1Z2B1_PRIPA